MDEAIGLLLRSFDTPIPILNAEELARWPANARDVLVGLGLLRAAGNAGYIECPSCESRHVEEVVACEDSDGATRFYISCPESLREEIPAASLQQWTFDWTTLAKAVAAVMQLSGRVKPVVPDRIWSLGRVKAHGVHREVILARTLDANDNVMLELAFGGDGTRLVFVGAPPPRWSMRAPAPAIVELEGVLRLSESGIDLSLPDVMAAVTDADRRRRESPSLTGKKHKILIQREVREALTKHQVRDVLVEAYRQHQTYQKAADALTAEGFKTNRWMVERAVQRAGGIAAVMRRESSQSVRRSAPSHPREEPGKF